MPEIVQSEILYDEFKTKDLDLMKWTIAAISLADGAFWKWEEPDAIFKTGDGKLTLTVNPYTKFHHQVQIFDNPKHLYLATQSFPVENGETINFSCEMGAITHNGNPQDLRDGFASFNVLDFKSGMVFDFIVTSQKIGIIYERLFIPGLIPQEQAFTEIIEVDKTSPGQLQKCQIEYEKAKSRVSFYLNGEKVHSQKDIPASIDTLNLGFGLITLKPIQNGKSVSLHGQGGTGIWQNFKILKFLKG